jgi:cell division septation protein DedD
MPYTMDGLRKDVKAAMNPTIYRVQVGAFSNEQNAKNLLAKLKKAGFDGFITK